MLNCRQTSELCSQELERKLSMSEQVSLATHLMMCRHCSNYKKHIRLLHQAASAYSDGRANLAPDSAASEGDAAK